MTQTHRVPHLRPPGGCACCSFLPPHIVRRLAESDEPDLRRIGVDTIEADAIARTRRQTAPAPMLGTSVLPGSGRRRLVCDMEGSEHPLPGKILRKEGSSAVADEQANQAYEHAGTTYDFYKKILKRESLDDAGYPLVSSIHFGFQLANAFWDGQRMIYGDGDDAFFLPFTRSLTIAAHEMSHGVISFTSNLAYLDQSGALNESFCDVIAAAVTQWSAQTSIADANWCIGGEVFGPRLADVPGVRSFTAEPAFVGHPVLGDDLQPKHMDNYDHRRTDAGGVHINSGIPNHAFYLAAQAIGGNVWDVLVPIWYDAFTNDLPSQASFIQAAGATVVAARRSGTGVETAISEAWEAVGVHSEV